MCRLFASLGVDQHDSVDFLIDAEKSLLKQSSAKKGCLQKDGWGVGWHDKNGKPRVIKSALPIYKEKEAFRSAAEEAASRIIIGHVRAASNPLGLDKKRLLDPANNQPFTDGRWLFGHNGTLSIPREVTAAGKFRSKLKAENDSEVWFYHLLKHLKKAGSFHEAAASAIAELWEIWDGCKKDHPGLNGPYTGLNFLLTDGVELHALCHQASKGMALFGACNPDQPWGQMSYSERPGRLLVASEDMDSGDWTRLDPPETLTASYKGGRFSVQRRRLDKAPQAPLPRPQEEAVKR